MIVDVKFKRLDTGGDAISHYTLRSVTFPAGKSDLFCFNLKDQIFAQTYLTGHLQMDKLKAVWVSRLRVVTEAINTDFYIDNVYMGKSELKGWYNYFLFNLICIFKCVFTSEDNLVLPYRGSSNELNFFLSLTFVQ